MKKYSVLMSVYYKEQPEFLREAINSMIHQTFPPDEIVLICDGKLTKELDSVIEQFENEHDELFHLVRLEENQGLGRALAIGVHSCRNEIIARMDTDDIAVPDRMESQISFLEENPDISVVGGQIQEFNQSIENKEGFRYVPLSAQDVRTAIATRNPMNHMTVTFKKESVLAVGNYQYFDRFEDYYLWARLVANGYKLANIDKLCVYARVNNAMYKRRAGLPYFKQTVQMENYLLENGLASKMQYCKSLCVRFVGVVLVPNWFRKFLYTHLMRKKEIS